MAKLGATTVTSIESDTAASTSKQCVRFAELQVELASLTSPPHTHSGSEVTDITSKVQEVVSAMPDVTASLNLRAESNRILGDVILNPDGALEETPTGLAVILGSGSEQAASGAHTHTQLHDPLTVVDSTSVNLSLDGQELTAESILVPGGGLEATDSGVEVDATVSRTSHTHAQLHDAMTVERTNSFIPALTGQRIRGSVVLAPLVYGQGMLDETVFGLCVRLGDSGTEAAAGDHPHAAATSSEAGFLSAAQFLALQQYQTLLQQDQVVSFHRPDFLPQGEYVGGRARWAQNMEITGIDVVSRAPTVTGVTLGIEVNGGVVQGGISVPFGVSNDEVTNAVNFTDLFIPSGEYVRILCESGVVNASDIEKAPSMVNVSLNVRSALGSIPELRLNCGNGAVSPFAEDSGYDGGTEQGVLVLGQTIDVSGVSDPAPEQVYWSARTNYNSTYGLKYVLTGLARGIAYKVRLHFAELWWSNVGDQVFNITVTGKSTEPTTFWVGFDTLAVAGAPYKAVVREATGMLANDDGQIIVQLTPNLGAQGYNVSINAIEVIQDI